MPVLHKERFRTGPCCRKRAEISAKLRVPVCCLWVSCTASWPHRVVVLEPDVAKSFSNADDVNRALRALAGIMRMQKGKA